MKYDTVDEEMRRNTDNKEDYKGCIAMMMMLELNTKLSMAMVLALMLGCVTHVF